MGSSLFLICFTLFFSVSLSQHILLPLTHSLSKTHHQFNSTPHLLRATSASSAARFHLNHHRKTDASHHQHHQVSLPLSPGSDYTLSFNLNTKTPQTISLYMDTGSDLVWFPCAPFECILCEGEYNPSTTTPPVNITSTATTVPCSAAACSAVHASSSLSSSNLCAIARCPLDAIETKDCQSFSCPPFYYAYGDGSLIAQLHQHPMTIATSSPALSIKNFTFGCAHTTLGEPIGVAGFGRGMISLPAQLASLSPHLGKRFSYCLISHAFDSKKIHRPSPLILGRSENKENKPSEFAYTGMLENPKHPYFYLVGLQGISVGKTMIPAPEIVRKVDLKGNGGMVVDSGTTFTMLPESFYYKIVDEFDRRVGRVYDRADRVESKTGLGPCYYFDKKAASVIPSLTLHFVEEESSVVLPRKNYFYEFVDGSDETRKNKNVGCLMLMNGGDEKELEGGPGATLGNYQQQGFEVVYDLESNKVGFAKRQCALLWDTLNKS